MKKFFHSNNNKFLIIYNNLVDSKDLAKDGFVNGLSNQIIPSNEIDGIIWIDNIKDGFVFFDLFNIDGSRAEVSGNGLACLSIFLYNTKKIKNFSFVNSFYRNKVFYSRVINGGLVKVGFDLQDTKVLNKNYKDLCLYEVNIPNPHLVVPIVDLDEEKALNLAADIFTFFQKKYNVHLFDYERMFMYTFERGVGFTYSCGSGTIACSYIYINIIKKDNLKNNLRDLPLTIGIASKGGEIKVSVENGIYWLLTSPKEY